MMHKSGGRGTFVLDRVFPNVGRIRRASGTTNRPVFDSLNQMVSTFWNVGRLDLLIALRDGGLHPLVAWETYRMGGVHAFPAGAALRPLTVLETWATALAGVSRAHRRNVQSAVRMLLAAAMPGEPLGHVSAVLRRYRQAARPRMFNVVRAALQALLRDNCGPRDALYLAVGDIAPLPYRPRPGHPLTPMQLASLELAQPSRGMVWTMALTGMGPGEYWGAWTAREECVEIHGTKRPGRARAVPLVGTVVAPATTYRPVLTAFQAAAPGHVLYDLRRSYAVWLEEAGIPPSRTAMYLGHGPTTMTMRYQMREVAPYLAGDAALLRGYLGDAQQAVRAG